MSSLQQINVKYDAAEDRLLLRLRMDEKSEIRTWLTRRYTKLMLMVLEQLTSEGEGSQDAIDAAMKEMKRDAALAGADFKTDYQSGAEEFPLGEEPVLVTRISYKALEAGNTALALGMANKKNINLNLNRNLLFVLIQLLRQGAQKAEWDLEEQTAPLVDLAQNPSTASFH